MSDKSAIEWTGSTWNPLLGCSKVSAGCLNCYAIREAWKKQHHRHPKVRAAYQGLVERRADGSLNWTGRVNLIPERLEIPLRWREPRLVFVNSLSDLFHEAVPDAFIDRVFAVMALTPRHTFQVLTKRPERMAGYLSTLRGQLERLIGASRTLGSGLGLNRGHLFDWPLPNVWIGTSTEDQRTADERIPHLLRSPAAVRFLSCEPLVGPIDLGPWLPFGLEKAEWMLHQYGDSQPIHWVIVGGESGGSVERRLIPGSAQSLGWVRSLRDQCVAADVPFFFKQWGGARPKSDGRELDGRTWDEMPSMTTGAVT